MYILVKGLGINWKCFLIKTEVNSLNGTLVRFVDIKR